ncbi:MAG: right-handed parallel beta-helix repeat-containing protein [Planctomycetota bacterium]
MKRQIFLLAWLILAVPCQAETIIVEPNGAGDFNNIQDAINYSWNGDTVVVRPGLYDGPVYFHGRAITLTSENPNDPNVVESTIITTSAVYSVTFDFGESTDSVLTGFTVLNRGIYCYASSPTIAKNIIKNCNDRAISGENEAKPTISNNVITNNLGGIYRCYGLITNNVISGNIATYGGGLRECFVGRIENNTIVGNWGSKGGGLYNCITIIKNNIIAFNRSPHGGGIYGSGGALDNSFNAFWENTGGDFYYGATAGIGDIYVPPLFAVDGSWDDNDTPTNTSDDFWVDGEYHLKSEAGRWDANSETWVIDADTSLCIDAGDPCDIIGIEPNPNGGRINMGAYGGTAEASKSGSGIVEPVCVNPPSMDTNGDCKIDFIDFAGFASQWLECNLDPPEACWE